MHLWDSMSTQNFSSARGGGGKLFPSLRKAEGKGQRPALPGAWRGLGAAAEALDFASYFE